MKKIIVLILLLALISGNVNACDVYCSTCEDCSSKINLASSWQTICLNANITNYTGTCINPSSFNNKIFDCQENIITGNAFYVSQGASMPAPTYGIFLNNNQNTTIRNCIISGFGNGIALDSSLNDTLINSTTYSNDKGIVLKNSPNNFLRNNTMFNNNYNFNIFNDFYQDIDISNSVDGKAMYYWTNEKNTPANCKNAEINEINNAGFVALISCDNITVKNLNLHNNSHGILLVNTTNSKILNNTINATFGETYINGAGIYLSSSQNNFVMNNILSSNKYGISLDSSFGNRINSNTINLSENGIYLSSSNDNNITNNTINLNENGMYLSSSSYNILTNNTADSNGYGISLYSSLNNNLTNNTITSSTSVGINILNSHSNKILENKILENTKGIMLSTFSFTGTLKNINNTIERNEILYNNIGISSRDSDSIINSNVVCENDFDFNSSNWESSLGHNNTCNNPDGWNDTNKIFGCTNTCKIDCNCSSYNQCMKKSNNSNCPIVTLLKDITLYFSPISFNNKTFDCQGHKIIGNGNNDKRNIGIKDMRESVIKNCIINNFTYGIYLNNNFNTIVNNTLSSNNYGIYLSRSSSNTIINNTIKENSEFDFYIDFYWEPLVGHPQPNYSSEYCNNVLENNIGSGNTLIKFFNHSVNLSNEIVSELILCNADNSNINNVTIAGSNILKNNELFIFLTENSNFTNINSSNNKHGVYIEKSLNNVLTNITTNLNNNYGIYLKNSLNNIISNSKTNLNSNGIFLQTSSNNTIINSTANSNKEYGISIYDSSNNILTNNTANSNIYGIYLYSSPNNTMKNNTMKNNTYNFNINGFEGFISNFYQDIDPSNSVDNKSIFYLTNEKNAWNGCKNTEISELDNPGFLALISCDNITIKNLNLHNNSHGILLVNTTNSKILNNVINSNYYAIHLFSSSNNTLNSNIACENTFLDFYMSYPYSSSYSNTGENNTCKLAAYWKDSETEGCTHSCSGVLCICEIKLGFGGTISRPCNCCTQFDFDSNGITDIFDAVAALEYLSVERNEIFNMNCSDVNNNGIDLIDIFYLIEKLQGLH